MRYNDKGLDGSDRPGTALVAQGFQTPGVTAFELDLVDELDGEGATLWLTPEAAVELAGVLNEWVRSLDK